MLNYKIPGWKQEVLLKYLVLDFNGTIALDGKILPQVIPLIRHLASDLEIYVVTADTFGTARKECDSLAVKLHQLTSANHTEEKGLFVHELGKEHVIAMGNGRNDLAMLQAACIGIGILGNEGTAAPIYQYADLMASDIESALQLLIHPKRLIASLRC